MKINVLSEKNNIMKFVAEETTPSFFNTIRRIVVSEVPTMAIEEVAFTRNSSVLYDEIIAHRLGLVPLTTDLKTYKLPADCKCKGKGCTACQAKLTLNVKGPKTVYSGDLKSKDPKIKPFYSDIPITKLGENQEIKLTATAVLGIGKEHSKWVPGLFVYQGYPEIKITSGKQKLAAEVVAACPRNALELKDGSIKIKDLEACNLCKACEKVNPEAILVKGSREKFLATLESWGQLSPKEILNEATNILGKKLKQFDKLIK